jgi:zinc resistance-associated protein
MVFAGCYVKAKRLTESGRFWNDKQQIVTNYLVEVHNETKHQRHYDLGRSGRFWNLNLRPGRLGPGMMGPGMMGPGWQQGGGYYGNLPADEIAKLDQQRADFFQATQNTRQQLYEKNLALQSELAKENPDTARASRLQSEISTLQSDFDQKRLEYDIQARKSAPNYNRGSRGGYGSMMRYAHRGGGYCGW